jgi:dynein heavy chain
MNPTAGSFYVNPRLQRNYWTCSVPEPKRDSLSIIYSTILDGHFRDFKQGIKDQKNNIIKGALQLHQSMQKKFKKTAINFHYEFNVRHLAGLFSGILLSTPKNFTDVEKIPKLWLHECMRIYGDRLVSRAHLDIFREICNESTKATFKGGVNMNAYLQKQNAKPLIFCNFS